MILWKLSFMTGPLAPLPVDRISEAAIVLCPYTNVKPMLRANSELVTVATSCSFTLLLVSVLHALFLWVTILILYLSACV